METLTKKERALREILSAVMQHKFAKTDEATKIWYGKIREGLKEYYNAIAEESFASQLPRD